MPEEAMPNGARETVYRTCPLCEAHCGVAVEVDRATQGVVTVRGDEQDPFSRGFLCPKAYGLKGLHEDPDRLRRPLRRRGARGDAAAQWDPIGWDEALELVASRLRALREAHGADAVATYLGNPNAHDLGAILYAPTFQKALGTRWRFSATSVDQLPKMVSCSQMLGSPGLFPIPDVDRTDFFLMLGANPLVSNGSLMTAPDMPARLAALRARGGKLVVVDPRRSETAAIADRHLPIRPGADAYFLFSLIQVLFADGLVRPGRLAGFTRGVDELRALAADFRPEATAAATGIAPDAVRALARGFAAAERAVCYGRIGTCTQEFGALASWLVDVVNVLTGNLDREGGACFPRGAASPKDDTPRKRGTYPYGRWRSRVRGLPEFAGELPAACLAEEIDTPGPQGERVRALVTVAGNPVLSTPNGARLARALATLEFMVSIDIYVNETTRFADLILPPAGALERSNYDLAFNAVSVRNYARWSPVVIEPPPDAHPQWEILAEIAGRVNGASAEAVDELMAAGLSRATGQAPRADLRGPERLLDLMLRGGPYGLSLEKLQSAKHGIDLGPLEGGRLPRLLATESGAIELAPSLLVGDVARLRARLAERSRPDGLLLIGRRHLRSNNSWMHNVHALAKGKERCTLLVHPDDAARLGLADGAAAVVRSRAGEIRVPVSVTDEMMPGVVSLPHGFGHGAPGVRLRVAVAHAGQSSNDLADELGIDALSGNAILNGIPVEVSPAA
jgi:anaerobic selenocysteine-containing dehydrogenase